MVLTVALIIILLMFLTLAKGYKGWVELYNKLMHHVESKQLDKE